MAIVVESTTTVASVFGGSGVGNFKLDVPTCSIDDFIIFCRSWCTSGGGAVSGTPQLNAVNMTQIANQQTNNRRTTVHIGRILAGGTGSCTFTDTGDDNRNSFSLGAYRLSGVDTGTPFGLRSSTGDDGTAASISLSLASAAGRLVCGIFGANGHYAGVVSLTGGGTEDANFNDTNATGGAFQSWMGMAHIAGASSVSIGYTGISPLTQITESIFEIYPIGGVPAILLPDLAHQRPYQALVAQ